MSDKIDGWERRANELWTDWHCFDNRTDIWNGSSIEFESNTDEQWISVCDRNEMQVTAIPISVLRALLAEHGLHIVTEEERQQQRMKGTGT